MSSEMLHDNMDISLLMVYSQQKEDEILQDKNRPQRGSNSEPMLL